MNKKEMKIIGKETLANKKDMFNVSTQIYNLIRDSESLYPGFCNWYFGKFVPGLEEGKRRIVISYFDSDISGIALVKNEGEKKICCIKVNDKYRKMGIGIKMFEKCLELLDTERPMITVADERMCSFSKILKYYGFKLEGIHKGYYRDNSTEYVFNGLLIQNHLNNWRAEGRNNADFLGRRPT